MSETFRSLRIRNYRLWAAGAMVSNIGTWMQRTAQDWLVLTHLTHHNATAVGIVMALQFGPQLVLLPFTGLAADRLNRRKLLMATQAAMGTLALGLGLLTISGMVQLWHVYVFALLLGCVAAFDAPARQTFVAELVSDTDLSNAVALNSTSFNAARMVGPAVAGMVIAATGPGEAFLLNALSFVAVLVSLACLRKSELFSRQGPVGRKSASLMEGFRYVWMRPDLRAVLAMLFLVATFGLNFPIFISTMSVGAFHGGPGQYGLLSSTMAIGSVTGALLAARRAKPRFGLLVLGSAVFGFGTLAAALMPNVMAFGMALVVTGVAAQTITTSTNSLVQLSTEPALRGRVIAILLATLLGSTPIGAPVVGWVADTFGPRWALGVAAAAGLASAAIGLRYLVRHRGLRLRVEGWRLRWSMQAAASPGAVRGGVAAEAAAELAAAGTEAGRVAG
ncbi:MFS transporter [Variovorax sp. dw_954]|uniref:MFS transporter n=1 Tax=Variovorax sp. dw_954 TaxID=2720078 RepID=UPI001BD6650B|nr:MFS transporter [Variovorax sp. dw_954]